MLLAPGRSGIVDLAFYIAIVSGVTQSFISLVSLGLSWAIAHAVPIELTRIGLHIVHFNSGFFLIDLPLFIGASTFFHYWSHRLFHTKRFWFVHRVHHSAEFMSPLVATRDNPIQLALDGIIVNVVPFMILDPAPKVIAVAAAFTASYQFLVHGDLQWSWGWFGRWILMSPINHRVHHAAPIELRDRNFGILILWDRIFGTYTPPPPGRFPVGLGEPAPIGERIESVPTAQA
jgi:sterol desaturase/sphingolipid hydroxylase (fatty acid hydroxylase superfamily)